MHNFFLMEMEKNEYFLFCLSFEGFLPFLDEIQVSEKIKNNRGFLVIDQLLATGNNDNRFIKCDFDHGHLDLPNAHYLLHADKYRMISSTFLQKHPDVLNGSILTRRQRQMICEKQII